MKGGDIKLNSQETYAEALMAKSNLVKQSSNGEKNFVIYKVMRTIITSGVSPLPRNYELFYALLSGHNNDLSRDILSLPHAPDQTLLDKIGEKYTLPGFANVKSKSSIVALNELINTVSVRLLRSVAQLDAAQSALTQIKEPPPALKNAIGELRKQQQELQAYLTVEHDKLALPEQSDDSIAPIATRDTLTGLPNRILFSEKMAELYNDTSAIRPASLIVVNIDHLRNINTSIGISETNKAICRLALMLKRRVKSFDFVARISGNEFAIIVNNVPQTTAGQIAERLRAAARKIRLSRTDILTLSVGVAENSGTKSANEFYARAELALLASRTGRRDCVTLYDKSVAMRSRQAYLLHLPG
jgi:diguanylate cyclase